jgi:hypothetical protein
VDLLLDLSLFPLRSNSHHYPPSLLAGRRAEAERRQKSVPTTPNVATITKKWGKTEAANLEQRRPKVSPHPPTDFFSARPNTRHESSGKDLSHVPCKFFKAGSCTVGATCPFSHTSVEPGQKGVCTWFVKGGCKFGHKCALAHILPGQSMAMDRKNKKAAQQQGKAANQGHAESSGLNRNEGRTPLLSAEETIKDEDADVAPDDSGEIIAETKPSFSPYVTIPSPPSKIFKPTSPEVNEFSAIGSAPAFALSRNRGPLSDLLPGTSPSKGLGILTPSPFPGPSHQATFAPYDRVQDSVDFRPPAGSAASFWENHAFASKLVPPSQRSTVLRTYPSEGSAVDEEDLVLDSLTDLFTPEERFRRNSRSKADAGGLLHPSTDPHHRHSWADSDHHWTKSQPTHQTTSNSEDQTVRTDERGPSTPKRPTLGVLVEIDPEPHRGLGEITYQIASDLPSPTTTVSSTESDESGEEYDIRPPSNPFEPVRPPHWIRGFQN